jgi:hypothetical protein
VIALKGEKMQRIVFHAPEDMAQALREEASSRLAPVSAIVREALEEYFEKRGIEFERRVEWGKPTENEDQSPETVGMLKVSA